jgi:hypothetical protein
MARTKTDSNVESNGLPQRTAAHEGGIPRRGGGRTNQFSMWAETVAELRDNLGTSFEYADLPKCQTVAQGLRREYGILAAGRGVDKESGVGTLYIEYPSLDDGTGNLVEDTETVAEIKEKYSK